MNERRMSCGEKREMRARLASAESRSNTDSGVSRRTIYNWLSSGKIEYVRTAGGSVRIFVDTLWRDPHKSERPAMQGMWQAEGRNQA